MALKLIGFAGVLLASVVLAGAVAQLASGSGGPPTEATIVIHYSHFDPDVIEARAGQPITITLRNDDPIEHEWMVGDAAMHQRHRTGTEPFHNQIPTEVTIPALSERITTVNFDQPGDYL